MGYDPMAGPGPAGMMDMLGGGGMPPAPPAAPAGPNLSGAPVGDHTDHLREAIRLIGKYMEEEQDDEDLAMATDILAKAQKLLASQQKLADTAMGMGPPQKFVRKQFSRG